MRYFIQRIKTDDEDLVSLISFRDGEFERYLGYNYYHLVKPNLLLKEVDKTTFDMIVDYGTQRVKSCIEEYKDVKK